MEPEADFPAAHSMDTSWFAVDRDGHIAVFDSGEAGAVPIAAGSDQEDDLLVQLAFSLPAVSPLFDLKEWIGHGDSPGSRHIHSQRNWVNYRTMMFLERLDSIRDELGTGLVAAPPTAFGHVVFFEELSFALFRRIHDAGECRACVSLFRQEDWAARMGLFYYSHTCENWISGPYAREGSPFRPLRIDEIAPDLRARIEGMRFATLCFGETQEIQPVDHGPCDSSESAYLALDHETVRPLPGREEDYRAALEESSEGADLEDEPPSG
jgi:hypothetical protein